MSRASAAHVRKPIMLPDKLCWPALGMGVQREIQPGVTVCEGAGRVLRLHPLRAADSLQLAAALIWAKGLPEMVDFVCLDHRLREAARLEGFRILSEDRIAAG